MGKYPVLLGSLKRNQAFSYTGQMGVTWEKKSVFQSVIFEADLELGFRLKSPLRFARDFLFLPFSGTDKFSKMG
jgi:hypothetical protein